MPSFFLSPNEIICHLEWMIGDEEKKFSEKLSKFDENIGMFR